MKKLFLFAAMMLMTGIAFGQPLLKGNLVGAHVMTITLKPGVTMEKFIEFYKTTVIPGYSKYYGGKAFLIKSIRGENKDSFGAFMIFNTEKERDRFYNPDGSDTELSKSINEKMKPIYDELSKLGDVTSVYNDWLVL